HQRYLVGETGSDPDSPAPKPSKPARKPKSTVPKAPPRPSVLKPVSSTQPEPKFAPAKTQGNKRKLTTEIFDKPSKAIKSRHSFVSKKRMPNSTPKSVHESVAEDIPVKEPRVDNEEADVQRALEESMKSMYDVPRGPLPPVVIREPESRKYQPLPEPKRKSPVDQYIFQRCTSTPTGSSKHNESSSLYAKLGLTDSKEKIKEDVLEADAGGQSEGQARPDPSDQDKGQAGSNPDEQAEGEGQAGPDPGNAEESQPMPSHVVLDGSDCEHIDLDVADVSPQPPPEQMDEGFTTTAYPKFQENIKFTVKEQVLLEEPASSSGTLSSLQHLTKDHSFGDLFFIDKPSKADNDKATAETEAESMVMVTIQQDMSSIPPMTTPTINLTSRPESPKVRQVLKATATKTTTTTTKTTTTLLPPPYQSQQSTAEAMMMKRIGELEHIIANLIQENKRLEQRDLPEADMKEILHQRMWETDSYKHHEDHMQLYEALEKSMNRHHSKELVKDLAEARKKKKKSHELPKTPPGSPPHQPPPPPLPPAGPSEASGSSRAFGSSQVSTNDEDIAPDEQAHTSNDEDIGKPAWSIPSSDVPVPTNNWASALTSNYSPPLEDSLLVQTGDIAMFMDWFCKRQGITELKPQDLEDPAFEIVKVFHPDAIHLQYQMEECHKLLTDSVDDSILRHNVSKPLPLGGPPGQVTIQSDFFFNKDLE
nr:hypothetical protein [Tanacetum cinerariifolium]